MVAKGLLDTVCERQGSCAAAEPFVRACLNLIGALGATAHALQLNGLSGARSQGGYLTVIVHSTKLGPSGSGLGPVRRTRAVCLSFGGRFEDLAQERLAPFILRIPCSEPLHTAAERTGFVAQGQGVDAVEATGALPWRGVRTTWCVR
jgi:hypothetical protein